MNNNGFADAADQLGKLASVDIKKISQESLKEAAEFYVSKLIPNIPKSLMKKKHMKDQVKVEIRDEEIAVVFEETAYYWRFVEKGTVNTKAQHFAGRTWSQHRKQIEEIMQNKFIKELEK